MKNTPKDFLLEIGCEELPAKNLRSFADQLAKNIAACIPPHECYRVFATPRRIAVLIKDLQTTQADSEQIILGPAVTAPEQAKNGFMKKYAISPKELKEENGRWVFKLEEKGKKTEDLLPELVQQALSSITGFKLMRWGNHATPFLRPVHWVVMLYGKELIKTELFGLKTTRETFGHRFLHPKKLTIPEAREYEELLLEEGFVIADAEKRKAFIRREIELITKKHKHPITIDEDLLDEVTGLVEWPVALWGEFPKEFLSLPQEVLTLSLQQHQKYFPVAGTNNFVVISNIPSKDPKLVMQGNERVVKARLADAAFFYAQDQKEDFEERFELLKHVTFQQKLGSMADKVGRIVGLSEKIAELMHVNPIRAKGAASLCKNDLTTNMVGEFPELQGIIGEYYVKQARLGGEREEIAIAVREHYLPRFAGDELPKLALSCVVALADRIDTLESIFSIQGAPTGDKDPFGLRRAALGIIRIIVEKELKQMLLSTLISREDVRQFILDRLPSYYTQKEFLPAVLEIQKDDLLDIRDRLLAVEVFSKLPEAAELSEANKRVKNILKKYENITPSVDEKLFEHPAEKELYTKIQQFPDLKNYTDILKKLAELNSLINTFFKEVMVEVEDKKIKLNRVSLLMKMRALFLKVADISLLQL